MKILVIAATKLEIQPAIQVLAHTNIEFRVTGIGMLATAVSLTKILLQQSPDLVIQVGIAGTFNNNISLGNVVVVSEEVMGDIGVDEAGVWKDIFDLNLISVNSFPFANKQLINPSLTKLNCLHLEEVRGITVNQISTNSQHIKQLITKYKPDTESMEGAALHYVCTDLGVPFIQIRSISNYIGERDKTKWQMKEAINNLNQILVKFVNDITEIAAT